MARNNTDEQEYQEYLEYLEYQDYLDQVDQEELERLEAQFGGRVPAEIQMSGEAEPSQARTLLENFAQIPTAGHLAQAQALTQKYVTDPLLRWYIKKPVDLRTGQEFSGEDILPEKSYLELRDENLSRQEAQNAAHPGTALIGKGVGVLATAPMLPVASTLRGGAALGAAQGALYNPGDTRGEINPVQAGERLGGATVGALIGAPAGALAGWLGRAKEVRPMVKAVEDPAKLQDLADDHIQAGVQAINKRVIAPKGQELKKLLQGKTIKINPDQVERGGMDKLAKTMRKNSVADEVLPAVETVTEFVDPNSHSLMPQMIKEVTVDPPKAFGPLRREISAERALRLKRAMDSTVKYHKPASAADTAARTTGEGAERTANYLRDQLNSIKGVDNVNSELSEALRLRQILQERGRRPIAAVTSKNLDRMADMKKFDNLAGTDLVGFGEKVNRARELIPDARNWAKPLVWLQEARKTGERGLIKASPTLAPLHTGGSDLTLKAILESKREK